MKLLMDNMSAIALSRNPVHHDRSKHIDTKYHFIRECIEEGKMEVDHVGTARQLADISTKSLGVSQVHGIEECSGRHRCATSLGGDLLAKLLHNSL